MSPTSDEVRVLLDRFRSEAPTAACSLARETVRGVVEGLSGDRSPGDWLGSRGGRIAVGAGLGLFALGFLAGRRLHFGRRALLRTGVAAAAGFALGLAIGAQTGRQAQPSETSGPLGTE